MVATLAVARMSIAICGHSGAKDIAILMRYVRLWRAAWPRQAMRR